MKTARRPSSIALLIALELILAFLGFASGLRFLQDPSGTTHGMDTSLLATTPISTFAPVGLFFVACYGALPILASYGLWKLPRWRWTDFICAWTGHNWSWTATMAIGTILIGWITVEVALIGSPAGMPRILQVAMAIFGAVLIALAMLPRVKAYTRPGLVTQG